MSLNPIQPAAGQQELEQFIERLRETWLRHLRRTIAEAVEQWERGHVPQQQQPAGGR